MLRGSYHIIILIVLLVLINLSLCICKTNSIQTFSNNNNNNKNGNNKYRKMHDKKALIVSKSNRNDIDNSRNKKHIIKKADKLIFDELIFILKVCDSITDGYEAQYKAERILLEEKYRALKQEVYDNRSSIVQYGLDDGKDIEKGIKGFWLQVLAQHDVVGQYITEDDATALEYLSDIKSSVAEDYTSYTLSFHFNENPFFTNTVLKKKYTISVDLFDEDPDIFDIKSSEIDWKQGKNLTVKLKSGKNKGQVHTVTKQEPKVSFFNFFKEEEDDEINPTSLSNDEDYEISHSIRTCIIPKAVSIYTNEHEFEKKSELFHRRLLQIWEK